MQKSIQIRSLWPYAAALLGGAFCYLPTLWWSHMHALAAVVAVIFGLTIFVCSKLTQSRGKLSLKVTIIILPLVTAVICVGHQQMSPYRMRQRTNSALKQAGLNVQLRRPEVQGEWFRDRDSGILLPYWLARLYGEDAMSDVYKVGGSLEAFQQVDIRRMHLPRLYQIELARDSSDPPLSVAMIDNLSKLKLLDRIEFNFEKITDADMPGLKELSKLSGIKYIGVAALTQKIEAGVDLSILPNNCWLRLSGDELTVQQAKQIQHLTRYRELAVDTLTADAVDALHSSSEVAGPLTIIGCTFDEAATLALTRYTGSIGLVNCKFPDGFKIDPQPGRIPALILAGTTIPDAELFRWIKESKMSEFETDQVLTPEMLEPFKKIETLKSMCYIQPDGEPTGVDLTEDRK